MSEGPFAEQMSSFVCSGYAEEQAPKRLKLIFSFNSVKNRVDLDDLSKNLYKNRSKKIVNKELLLERNGDRQ